MKKRTIFLFIFNDELTRKLARTTVAGLLGFFLICGGISGCDNGEDIVTPTETEVVETTGPVISDYDGDSIYFKQGGTIFEGHVLKGVSADEVRVLLDDRSEIVINVDRIRGTLLPDHPDLGTIVRAYVRFLRRMDGWNLRDWLQQSGRLDELEGWLDLEDRQIWGPWGEIIGVYSDGMCKISLDRMHRTDGVGKVVVISPPLIAFMREAA